MFLFLFHCLGFKNWYHFCGVFFKEYFNFFFFKIKHKNTKNTCLKNFVLALKYFRMFCVNDSKIKIRTKIFSLEREFLVVFQIMFSAWLGKKSYLREITKIFRRSFCEDLKIKPNLSSKPRLVRPCFYLVDLRHVLC